MPTRTTVLTILLAALAATSCSTRPEPSTLVLDAAVSVQPITSAIPPNTLADQPLATADYAEVELNEIDDNSVDYVLDETLLVDLPLEGEAYSFLDFCHKSRVTTDAVAYIGLTEADAYLLAEQRDESLHVLARDGAPCETPSWTIQKGRVYVTVANNVIANVS